jgi:predicted transcriptional regulator
MITDHRRHTMERLCNLLFELSNEERLTILTHLKQEPMKLTRLSQILKYTPQEASRNVSRLSEARLIRRDSDGTYYLSTLGEEALRLLDGYRFLSEHSEYFSTHTLRDIPGELTDRLGALVNAEQPREIMSTLSTVEDMMAEAEEYVLTIADSILMSYISLELESVMRGVKNRTINQRGLQNSPELETVLRREKVVLAAAGVSKFLEERWLDRVDVYLVMSEREVAGITFRTNDGGFDHMHFSGSDPRFHGWCKDLFEYYWARSSLT